MPNAKSYRTRDGRKWPHGKSGAPEHQPTDATREQVATFTGLGASQDEIARLLHLSTPTLVKHYRHELDTGATRANMAVARALFVNATRNNSASAQIYWTKARMKWRETTDLNVRSDSDPLALHLIAAQAVSEMLAKDRTEREREPPVINGVAEHANGEWRDEPPPKE